MSFTRDDVQRSAWLARISIDESEVDEALGQLSRVFAMIEEMKAVDVTAVDPMSHGQDIMLRLRDDVVTEVDNHKLFQAIAPRIENGLYLVPKVIE
ncbi:MAG: Asp-tRNA(Asn)/Glu-tRNA(Gln) amidotransferase subunit GatC [Pseudomonadota bacterium]